MKITSYQYKKFEIEIGVIDNVKPMVFYAQCLLINFQGKNSEDLKKAIHNIIDDSEKVIPGDFAKLAWFIATHCSEYILDKECIGIHTESLEFIVNIFNQKPDKN